MSNARKARFSVVSAVAVVIVAGCGGGDSDSAGDAPNPGSGFTGVYSVQVTPLTENGTAATAALPAAYEWVVQSTCDGADGACVAIATATDPDPKSNLRQENTEFVFTDGEWLRAEPATGGDCTLSSTGEVVEPGPGIHTTVLEPVGLSSTAPIQRLDGSIEVARSGNCGGVMTSRIAVQRTGDLPPDTPPLDIDVPADATRAADNDQVKRFDGTYTYASTYVSGPGAPIAPFETQFTATPQCTRDGAVCLVAAPTSGLSQDPVYRFVDGKFVQSFTNARHACPADPTIETTAAVEVVLTPEGDSNPVDVLRGTRTSTYTGACTGEVVQNLVVTRLATSGTTATEGAALDGRFDGLWLTYDDRPAAAGPAGTWNIDTTCDDGRCVSAAAVTAPDAAPVPLVLDFADGVWRGVAELPVSQCTVRDTGAVVGESAPLVEVVIAPTSADSPDEFVVTQTTYGTPPCTEMHVGRQLLRRTGERDPDVALPAGDALAAVAANAQAMSLSGRYLLESRAAQVAGAPSTVDEAKNVTFHPVCTRDGARCFAVQTDPEVQTPTLFAFVDDHWVVDYTTPSRSCNPNYPNSPERTETIVHKEISRTDTAQGPAQTLAGLTIDTYGGDCPATAQWTTTLTRLGDD